MFPSHPVLRGISFLMLCFQQSSKYLCIVIQGNSLGLCETTEESLLYILFMVLQDSSSWNPDSFFNIWVPGLNTGSYPEAH